MELYGHQHTLTVVRSASRATAWADNDGHLQGTGHADVLTAEEIDAARLATYFDTGLWGHPERGWSPEALVAQKRGVDFQPDVYGVYSPDNLPVAQQALQDVTTFLGFMDIDAYLNTVMREQDAIVGRFS